MPKRKRPLTWLERHARWRQKFEARRNADVPVPPTVIGAKQIAAYLGVTPKHVSDLRNPRHRAYDPRVAAAIRLDSHRALVADSFELFSIAMDRDAERSEVGRENVGQRKDRRKS